MSKKRWGLIEHTVNKYARDLMDFDYLDQLTEEELDWLDQFSREYYNDDFTNQNRIHTDKDQKRKLHDSHNKRRRDVWGYHSRMPYDYTDFTVFKDEGNDE
jgi:hypothetical protein